MAPVMICQRHCSQDTTDVGVDVSDLLLLLLLLVATWIEMSIVSKFGLG